MSVRQWSVTVIVVVAMVAGLVAPAVAANFNVYGHYEFKFEWTPKNKIRSHHDTWIGATVDSGPMHARFRLIHTPWWQMQHLQNNFALEEIRMRVNDRLFRGAPAFDFMAGHRIWVGWDEIGFFAYEPGIAVEGLDLGGFKLNGLFAVLDDYNQTTDSRNVAGLQIKRRIGKWDASVLYAGNATWASEADSSGARYLVRPPKEYNTVGLIRLNGEIGDNRTNVSAWAGVRSFENASTPTQHTPAYEVNITYPAKNDVVVKAGFRDYEPKFDPPYAKRDAASDPIRANKGQIGGYGQVDFKTTWPGNKREDMSVRLDYYVQRHENAATPDIDVVKGKVDWTLSGYALGLSHQVDMTKDTDALRNRTAFSAKKDYRIDMGRIEGKYNVNVDMVKGDDLAHNHKLELKLFPQAVRWTGVQPRMIMELKAQGAETTTALRLGARMQTVAGIWAEAEYTFSADHDLRNESYVSLGYRLGI